MPFFVITGPPGAGKTFVRSGLEFDLVVDWKELSEVLCPDGQPAAMEVAMQLCAKVEKSAIERWHADDDRWTLLVERCAPSRTERDHYRSLGAEVLIVESDFETCLERCASRREGLEVWESVVCRWFETFEPTADDLFLANGELFG